MAHPNLQDNNDSIAHAQRLRVDNIFQNILYEFPSLGIYIVRLTRCFNRSIETACINGKLIVLNPDWIATLPTGQLRGLLLHEIFHLIARHDLRRETRNPKIFNVACDHQINLLLLKERVELPADGCYDPKYTDMTAEQIYNQLYQDLQQEAAARQAQKPCNGGQGGAGGQTAAGKGASSEKGSGASNSGDPGEDEEDDDPTEELEDPDNAESGEGIDDEEDTDESDDYDGRNPAHDARDDETTDADDLPPQDEFDQAVEDMHTPWGEVMDLTDDEGQTLSAEEIKALQSDREVDNAEAQIVEQISQAIGTGAGLISRLRLLAAPPADPPAWDEVLESILAQASGQNEHDMSRPNKRWVKHGIYMPRRSEGDLGTVVIAMDTSGSVSDDLLTAFHDAIDDLLAKYTGTELYVLYCDDACSEPIYYPAGTRSISRQETCYRGGGTSFDPPFAMAEAHGIVPTAFIYLTDMYGSCKRQEPSFPTVWVTPLSGKYYYDHYSFPGSKPWGDHLIVPPPTPKERR